MYDRLCTDLDAAHPAQAVLGLYADRLDRFPLESYQTSLDRYLLVTDKQAALEEAKRLGMGFILFDTHFSEQSLLAHASWLDSPIPASCSLFLFDMGNVVVKNIMMLGKIAKRYDLDREEFFSDYLHYEFPLMEGFLSSAEYWQHIREVFGVSVEGDPFYDAFEPVFNDEMVTLIKALRKAGKRVVCASNTIDPHWRILDDMGALSLFDKVYASHLMHATKPSKYFFRQILQSEGCRFEDAYFVDDHEPNIHKARSFGLGSLLYADKGGRGASERLSSMFASFL
ncbi:HAD family hydrolase [Sphaerochaeta globosa]|uniref:HAD-superfamily hydrolase, subfamily IA, variant 3 n=1 Tax=Sphaerochaeta globosa (strain ATCC BAA-1886 / DSM 22777 / Buddy) TaxID=158189 RepID=F0RV52_SPHGB|nr:HAD-IA family hydrolase [Sphaerochaeta globosa]ADY12774.1 HAD-superfamily hydrolase, subfamily IA, variant 3 [Sphaerochaeta globosa str. Buddy]